MHNSSNFNHFGQGNNWPTNDNINQQKKLEQDRTKQQYKIAAEQCLDSIVRDYKNAKLNNIQNWQLDPSDKASVVRYYKRYWDDAFFQGSLFVILITFVLSFYVKWAVIGIFGIFILREMFAQTVMMRYLLNDHDLSKEQIHELKNKIFYKQLQTSTTAILTAALMFISFSSLMISQPIYLDTILTPKIIEILSKSYPFYITHELFAYFNVGSIMVLMFLKLYEKWSR